MPCIFCLEPSSLYVPWLLSAKDHRRKITCAPRPHKVTDCPGWEVSPVSASEYWAEVPPELRARMHYFNIPCETAPDSPFNPLNIVKELYRPGDFVVIKLDIDAESIEQVSGPVWT